MLVIVAKGRERELEEAFREMGSARRPYWRG